MGLRVRSRLSSVWTRFLPLEVVLMIGISQLASAAASAGPPSTDTASTDLASTAQELTTLRDTSTVTSLATDDLAGYLFTYFTGEGTASGEQIYFALSQGNDPLT